MRHLLPLLVLSTATLAWSETPCPGSSKDPRHPHGPCTTKEPTACVAAGDALIGIAGCRDEALERYRSACNRKHFRACSKLAVRLVQQTRTPATVKEAIALFTKACDGGSASGCNQLGSLTYAGQGLPKSVEGAMTLWARGCKGGHGPGCTNLGRAFRLQRDDARAERAFARACTLGDQEGCNERDVPPPE